ncbi:hypothetical protein MMC10_003570 [Thelotrema lepadinum]|nr:hypothetical protein [Thelotrema lepadinum]
MDQDSSGEDELSSPSLTSLRVTPRQGTKRSASEALSNDTPYSNLRRLATSIRRTPSSTTPNARRNRAPSTGAASDSRVSGRTTTTQRRYGTTAVGKYPRPVPAKRSAPSTPHAIRALEQRRQAALTPSRERRRSGRQQRDSPRDVLRNLSRVLAKKVQPVEEEEPVQEQGDMEEYEEDDSRDFERSRPRLSLPVDMDDSIELPPEMSVLEEDLTSRSVEAGRRALTEPYMQERSRLSEGALAIPGELIQSGFDGPLGRRGSPSFGDIDDSIFQTERQGDDTEDLRRLIARDQADLTQDEPLQADDRIPGAAFDDSTFRFDIPLDLQGDEDEEPELAAEAEEVPSDAESASEAEETMGVLGDPEPSPPGSDAGIEEERITSTENIRRSVDKTTRKRKSLRESRYGIPIPNLPVGVVKSIAGSFMGSSSKKSRKFNKDAVAALVQASDWYFEQLGEDLAAYSKHGRRKTIDETDVVTLMKRQRLLSSTSTPFSLGQRFLPRELLQELRMAPPKDDS